MRYLFFLVLALASIGVLAQENDRAELVYTERLSKQFPDSAFSLLREMYSQALARKDRVGTGICLQQMGQICYYLGNFPKALDFHEQADKLFREGGSPDLEHVASNLNDMGILDYYNRQVPLAWKNYMEALSIYRQTGNIEGTADTYGRIGHLFEKRQRYDSAFYFQRLALQEYSRISHKQGMAKIYENMGSIYEDLAHYDSAWYYFTHSLDLYDQAGEEVASIEVVNNLGDIYRKTGRYREAIVETGKALALSEKTNDLYEKGAAYRDLGKAYDLLHIEDSAYHYLELSRRAALDVYSRENNRQTAFLSVLFDIDKKNDEIVRLENARRITYIVTAGVVIVVALGVFLGLKIVRKQRKLMEVELVNKQLHEEKLEQELDVKRKGLTSYTLHVIQKNQLLEGLRERLSFLVKEDKRDQKKQLQQLIQQINQNFNHDQYWEEFRETFGQVHQQFFDSLKRHSEDLTGNDLRLLSLIKLNLSSGDIATLLGISQDSLRVSRYRVKKKLNLGAEESLTTFVQGV